MRETLFRPHYSKKISKMKRFSRKRSKKVWQIKSPQINKWKPSLLKKKMTKYMTLTISRRCWLTWRTSSERSESRRKIACSAVFKNKT